MQNESGDLHYLEFDEKVIEFDPVSRIVSVFYDDVNNQIFTVRSGGSTGVTVKSSPNNSIFFRMEDKGPLTAIKFSPKMNVLAVQRDKDVINFYNFCNVCLDNAEYQVSCKSKNTIIKGFIWCCELNIILIACHGIELYQVFPEKKMVKNLKIYNVVVHFYLYHVGLLLIFSGTTNCTVYPFKFQDGAIFKLHKFEINYSFSNYDGNQILKEKDVFLVSIYGQQCLLVIRHYSSGVHSSGSEIDIFDFDNEGIVKKSHTLKLDYSGPLAVNIVDNLIIVHHQSLKCSFMFDINLPGESDSCVIFHTPVTDPLSIRPFKLKLPTIPNISCTNNVMICDLYSPVWVIFQPNVIIDAKIGRLWHLSLCLNDLVKIISEPLKLVQFLLCRNNGKTIIFEILQNFALIDNYNQLNLFSKIFPLINEPYCWQLEKLLHSQLALPVLKSNKVLKQSQQGQIVIDQLELYENLFIPLLNSKVSSKFIVTLVCEYMYSLIKFHISVQHFIFEFLIQLLINTGQWFQMHQMFQYHVTLDSKQMACLMLSMEKQYPPIYHLALDMLHRLNIANDEIVEVLLSKKLIIPAMRLACNTGIMSPFLARKFLQASLGTACNKTFYSVYQFFKNYHMKGDYWNVFEQKMDEFFPKKNCTNLKNKFNKNNDI